MIKLTWVIGSLLAVVGCADSGTSDLVNTAAEPAGANCAGGGLRLDVGADDDDDGTLDAAEIDSTNYVCNGSAGSKVAVTAEPAGTNCPLGGTRVDVGADANGNGTLESTEVQTTRYVCNGGTGEVVKVFTANEVTLASNTNATAQTATIDVPAAGTVIAIATVDAYCTTAGGTDYDCVGGTPASDVCIRVTTSAADPGCDFTDAGNMSFAHLVANTTTSITRTSTFPAAVGAQTFYVRAGTTDTATAGEVGLWRRGLTLLYIP